MNYFSLIFTPAYMPYFQITLAAVVGMFVGVERNFAGKTAGMRTYSLVTMGSCLLVVVSNLVDANFVGVTGFDPMRLAASIIMGIGFLGAGVIFMRDHRVSGLTTAAGLWVAACLGIAIGFELFGLSVFAAIATFLILRVMGYVENKYVRSAADGVHIEE